MIVSVKCGTRHVIRRSGESLEALEGAPVAQIVSVCRGASKGEDWALLPHHRPTHLRC